MLTMPRTFRVTGTPATLKLPVQGPAADWRFGLDLAGLTVEQAIEPYQGPEPEEGPALDVSHVFTTVPGQGYTAWYERLLPSGAVIGSRTTSEPFDVADAVPPTQLYRISGVVTLEPVTGPGGG